MPSQSRKRRSASSNESSSQQSSQSLQSNKRAGWIHQMTLKNFMCHSHLEVTFNENINFVSGRNGSGKSALLAALTLGLGCKAKATHRGNCSSIKAFVKFGTPSASIEIIISNEGSKSYCPEKYGAKISIQRIISALGSSRYKIKDETGKVISTKALDVNDIASGLNIQVENPVCILSQDTARTFLNSPDPKNLFTLFFRATRLDYMHSLLDDSLKKQRMALQTFNEKREEESKLKQIVGKLKEKISDAQKVEDLNVELTQFEHELAWCKATVHEKNFNDQKLVVDRQIANLDEEHDLFEKLQQSVDKQKDAKINLETKLKNYVDAHPTNGKHIEEVTLKFREMETSIKTKKMSMASIQRQISFKKSDLEGIQAIIEGNNNLAKEAEAKKEERENQRRKCDTLKTNQVSLLQTYEDEMQKMTGNIYEKEKRVQSLHHELASLNNKISNLNERIKTLQNEANNPFAIYGPNMIRLVNAINIEERNFSRLPIGPIGMHVSIKDKRWSIAAESQLKARLLRSFLVNSYDDLRRLTKLVERVWSKNADPPPGIISSEFVVTPYDISNTLVERHPHCERLYDVLSVSNPIVMNCLIDQASIETILLIPDTNFGLQLLKDRRNVPRNCRIGVTPQGDEVHPDPNFKMYSGTLRQAKYLHVNNTIAENQCRQSIDAEKRCKLELQTTLQKAENELANARSSLPKLRQQAEKCRSEIEKLTAHIAQLNSVREDVVGNDEQLKRELTELENIIKTKVLEVGELKLEIETMTGEAEGLKEQMREYDSAERRKCCAKQELQKEIDDLANKICDAAAQLSRNKLKYEHSKELHEKETRKMNELQKHWEQIVVDTHREFGARPTNIRKEADIEARIGVIQQTLSRIGKRDMDKLKHELGKMEACISKNCQVMNDCEQVLVELRAIKKDRKDKLVKTKKFVKDFAIYNFGVFLKCRNYMGNMSIDYDNETLEMVVLPHVGNKGITPTANLSGGERSFATVALLYALWKCLDFPFYVLDEFDVFMDTQNRQLAIKILIDHARLNKDNQYIFLTPQDISFIKDKDVSLLRLEDPQRLSDN